jgi:hypothetical protein
MAHSAMHFGLGLAIGASAGLPLIRDAIKKNTSRNTRKWLLVSYVTGAIAVFPSFLGLLGVPESVTSAWFMNIFLFSPLIDRMKSGGKLIAETLIVSSFLFQYSILMFLLWRTKRKQTHLEA